MMSLGRLIARVNHVLLLLLVAVAGVVLSLPTDVLPSTRGRTITTTTEAPTHVDQQIDHHTELNSLGADYLNGEDEFQALLDRLRREAEQTPIKEDRRNYLGDNADIEQILAMIGRGEAAEHEELAGYIQEAAPAGANLGAPQRSLLEPEGEEDNCAICYDSMESTRNTRLECGHEFHGECLHSWRRHDSYAARRCPICRQNTSRIPS